MTKEVYCKFQVQGIHHWPNAPEVYKYLSYPHRHVFHFEVQAEVSHNDREIEIIWFKNACKNLVYKMRNTSLSDYGIRDMVNFGAMSCEAIGEKLFKKIIIELGIRATYISVLEDGENGAMIYP